jgi:ATP-dependent Lhr-like helicase
MRAKMEAARHGDYNDGEMQALAPLFQVQQRWSTIPAPDELLIEGTKTRDGHHLFIYPFAGRLVHEGLAALTAYRLGQRQPITFTIAANDYGFELLAADPVSITEALTSGLFSVENLLEDILQSSTPPRWPSANSARSHACWVGHSALSRRAEDDQAVAGVEQLDLRCVAGS